MLKMKIVDGLYCPTPFCDQCGKEIEGPQLRDPGAYVYVTTPSKCHEGNTFDLAFVHLNYAKNGDRCMDQWEAKNANRKNPSPDAPVMGWIELDQLVKFMANNPGFSGR